MIDKLTKWILSQVRQNGSTLPSRSAFRTQHILRIEYYRDRGRANGIEVAPGRVDGRARAETAEVGAWRVGTVLPTQGTWCCHVATVCSGGDISSRNSQGNSWPGLGEHYKRELLDVHEIVRYDSKLLSLAIGFESARYAILLYTHPLSLPVSPPPPTNGKQANKERRRKEGKRRGGSRGGRKKESEEK